MLSSSILKPLYERRTLPLLKIPLIFALVLAFGTVAWLEIHPLLTWGCYLVLGYLLMSVVTLMHDCTHTTLFATRWLNEAFGMVTMVPFLASFTAFKEDHLEHHKYNRSPKDPDGFTMGKRSPGDFFLFYSYIFLGVILSAVYFAFIYPIKSLRGKKAWVHWAEMAVHVAVIWALFAWAGPRGLTAPILKVWLIPFVFFGYFNSMRFIAEHYGTPWNAGQMVGTRTIISNQLTSYFWNNINYHIGHHVYPGVPFYNLQKLHAALAGEIKESGAIVDKSYVVVYLHALLRGPESPETTPRAKIRK